MIIAVDIETQGLDATKFLQGCVLKENGKSRIFYDKKDMWNYIVELSKKEKKRGKMLNVYAHNHEFDFAGYADLTDKCIRIHSTRPFIVSYEIDGKDYIKFLDTYAIYQMPLKKVGEIIGLPKLDTPKEFIAGRRISKKKLEDILPYIIRDCEIVLESIKFLKKKLGEDDVRPKRLYTISQVAVSYFINTLRKSGEFNHLFHNAERGQIYWTKYSDEIHSAYRGGRVECFKTGKESHVFSIDCNNLYGHASTHIDFPDLKTERRIFRPLKVFNAVHLFNKIGVSRVMIKNESCEIGLLPVRTPNGNYYPKKDSYLIGTYTHIELKQALKCGYRLIDVEWSVIWDRCENPFKTITPRLYELRVNSSDTFNRWFYKQMQNHSYGKLAQTKVGQEILIDEVEKARDYIEKNYHIINRIGYNYMYSKDGTNGHYKNYYAPIIPTLINAWARVYMYRMMERVPRESLLYTDTDSIIFKHNHLAKFSIGNELGQFKVEETDGDIMIYGRKTYAIGDKMKISGIRKRDIKLEDFEKGYITSKKMVTMKKAKKIQDVGKFIEETRDLYKQLENHMKVNEIMDSQKVYIDENISNINNFVDNIASIT